VLRPKHAGPEGVTPKLRQDIQKALDRPVRVGVLGDATRGQ